MTANRIIMGLAVVVAMGLVVKAWTERNPSPFIQKSPAPEIILLSLNGDTIRLSDFKGHYVMVDFWASWCAPCRRENQNLVRVYHELQSKVYGQGHKLHILSVSIDIDTVAWRKAVKNDRLFWQTQVNEPYGWEGKTVNNWGIKSIPAGFLIDPEGNIIARQVKAGDLDHLITENLK